eukprot:Pgem_evm1s3502
MSKDAGEQKIRSNDSATLVPDFTRKKRCSNSGCTIMNSASVDDLIQFKDLELATQTVLDFDQIRPSICSRSSSSNRKTINHLTSLPVRAYSEVNVLNHKGLDSSIFRKNNDENNTAGVDFDNNNNNENNDNFQEDTNVLVNNTIKEKGDLSFISDSFDDFTDFQQTMDHIFDKMEFDFDCFEHSTFLKNPNSQSENDKVGSSSVSQTDDNTTLQTKDIHKLSRENDNFI